MTNSNNLYIGVSARAVEERELDKALARAYKRARQIVRECKRKDYK